MLSRTLGRATSTHPRVVRASPSAPFSRSYSQNGPVPLSQLSENFIDGTSANYVEQMYSAWLVDPKSVHKSWDVYFSNVQGGAPPGAAFVMPPTIRDVKFQAFAPSPAPSLSPASAPTQATSIDAKQLSLTIAVQQLIRAYQVMGHNKATLDPLGIQKPHDLAALSPQSYGISESQMNAQIKRSDLQIQSVTLGFLSVDKDVLTVKEIIENLERVYCGNVGVEYMHIQDRAKCNWLRERIEHRGSYVLPNQDRLVNYDRLTWATLFEQYLGKKFHDKRFGCDGGEVMIPGLKTLIDEAGEQGIEDIVFGMAHRGRLNVLANVLRKPLESIFHEFHWGTLTIEDIHSGDVKYHLGTSFDRPTRQGKKVHLSLVGNPSHLETVNPVVEGKVAAKQFYTKDTNGSKVMGVLIHGDASFAGQGVVYETVTLSKLPKYRTGGTIHVIINNQIGFTTDPTDSRPGYYCTEVMKSTGAPIFHVNGDDPDAVCWVFKLAAEWRQAWHEDCVVDIVCYRRHGHNEVDQPHYTQPLLYSKIDRHPTTLELYSRKLISEGILTKERMEELDKVVMARFDQAFDDAKAYKPTPTDWLSSKWVGFKGPAQLARIKNTGIKKSLFNDVATSLTKLPEGFVLHPNIKRMLDQKKTALEKGEPLDWATGEALAFGSLLLEGFHVRLSGQDVERGTFSHRHAVLHDQKTGEKYTPLNNLPGQKVPFTVSNSFLSEYAVLGYEMGFSLVDPNALIIWEAQFGDFCNGAQIILDQYISSGEQKWMRQSGITLLLPHGMEGMGPEHSSARMERFLQMCDQDFDVVPNMDITVRNQIQRTNWQIVNCTTPANFFHVLRRQMHREFRKPLVIFTPKSLLRHPLAKSPQTAFDDSGDDTRFIRVFYEVDNDLVPDDKVKRVIFCTGKIYYDLYTERANKHIKNIPLVRIEQLAPFPFDHVQRELMRYPNAEVVWCQEEPKNMGAWTFVYFNFRTTLKHINDSREVKYIGRPSSASPATGSAKQHTKEVQKLLAEALPIL
eukprot:TRINITY_DN4007_c0_g1_i1.p1 TRINITY_DN4007_c0_g1~~TRINITY_DN4007_c0_g1_i1.p1  ORF type:complete len:1016 (-),score=165.40 TRINITY_DN4007_c0_g1_i1:37-3084(-)